MRGKGAKLKSSMIVKILSFFTTKDQRFKVAEKIEKPKQNGPSKIHNLQKPSTLKGAKRHVS